VTDECTEFTVAKACFTALHVQSDFEFSRLESWSRDVSKPIFTSLGLSLRLEPWSVGFGLGTSESWSWSFKPLSHGLGLGTWDHEDSVFDTHEA